MTVTTITESIVLGSNSFVIQQGEYSLTADSLEVRCQKPFHAGNDYKFEFTVVDPEVLDVNGDPTPIDIAGYTFRFCVKNALGDSTLLADIPGVIVGPTTDGRFDIDFPDTTFTNTTLVTGVFELVQTDAGGDKCTLIHGCIQILPKIC